ncbi:hypothetical protein [Actinacidiphila sp. ITFR-21]|uniref:hypothetical protein n=1 Tax=Actinacidiphila sp. ITFR-21 TaxID=3075199 RepID=UPI00288BADA8|nr:hypothetical protein [Streptomyces sp. ITFR-21]WNI20331.1 hypothetical protein RLT57_32525 [Streptomyces sp. ITFR-21]
MSVDPADLPRLFHGGRPGLNPGALLVPSPPHVVDGCRICEARAAGESYTVPGLGVIDPPTGRPDRVYVTSDREYARWYASRYWLGDLYVVQPVGDVEETDEDPFPTWCAPYAVVRSVYSRAVRLTMPERRRLYRRWGVADAVAAQRRRDETAARLWDGLE